LFSGIRNDNIVPAVPGHNVGASAIRFQNLPDALENEVALEVPVEIITNLKAV